MRRASAKRDMVTTKFECLLNRGQDNCGQWKASPRSEWGGRGCPSCIYRTPNFEGDGVSYEQAAERYDILMLTPPEIDGCNDDY